MCPTLRQKKRRMLGECRKCGQAGPLFHDLGCICSDCYTEWMTGEALLPANKRDWYEFFDRHGLTPLYNPQHPRTKWKGLK